jgi:hypothetical protein
MKELYLNFNISRKIAFNIVFNLERVIFVNDYDFHNIIRIAINDYLNLMR